ncbi:hypothetical protein PCANC_23460 [Puccinia coronata f. sp. avenae]|uniref:Uncharacterized protein n=1 Tax=Puccinia coronata f. sp. avenae TaxID=200324 RepID=A0A2N5ULA1_9BASI|nr:hypothetical protein PCANC_23460 [Puccinia coronata f. sp. avenae]
MSDRLQAINANLKRAARSNSEQISNAPGGDGTNDNAHKQNSTQTTNSEPLETTTQEEDAQTQLKQQRMELAKSKAALAKKIGVASIQPGQSKDPQGLKDKPKPIRRYQGSKTSGAFTQKSLAKAMSDLIWKGMEADIKGKSEKAERYFDMYKTLKASAAPTDPPKQPTGKQVRSPEAKEGEDLGTSNSPAAKAKDESVVEEPKFTAGALPKHNEMGFTPYFDKNIWELKGLIPLTIFNKSWKNTAILYHSEKLAKLDGVVGDRNCYTGFPYPSEWTQTFAEWTTNHQGFHNAVVNEYGFKWFAKWLLAHKANADAIRSEDASSTYATCRKFKELEFTNNPYAESGLRALWDPTTGLPRSEKKGTVKQHATTTPSAMTLGSAQSGANAEKSKAKAPRSSGYKGSDYDPNYQQKK